MTLHTLRAPLVEFQNVKLTLSKQLAPNAAKDIRASVASRLAAINKAPLQDRQRADPFPLLAEAVTAFEFAKKALQALRHEINIHRSCIAALKTGTMLDNAHPAVTCAVDSFHLAKLIAKHHENSALLDDLASAAATMEGNLEQLEDAESVATKRLEKARKAIQSAAKSSFCFTANLKGLLAEGYDEWLPDTWRDLIQPDTNYGQASFDPWEQKQANIDASILQWKFREMLNVEMGYRRDQASTAKDKLDAAEYSRELEAASK